MSPKSNDLATQPDLGKEEERIGSFYVQGSVYASRLPPCNKVCPASKNVQAWLSEVQALRDEKAEIGDDRFDAAFITADAHLSKRVEFPARDADQFVPPAEAYSQELGSLRSDGDIRGTPCARRRWNG